MLLSQQLNENSTLQYSGMFPCLKGKIAEYRLNSQLCMLVMKKSNCIHSYVDEILVLHCKICIIWSKVKIVLICLIIYV